MDGRRGCPFSIGQMGEKHQQQQRPFGHPLVYIPFPLSPFPLQMAPSPSSSSSFPPPPILSIIKILLLFWPIFSIDSARSRRNNIILVITDDQDVLLGSLDFMPKTLRLLAQRGVTFPNAFVGTPICCPSRSTILSGVYAHNHQVMTNNQRCAGQEWRNGHEQSTFGVHLMKSGYTTGFFGKYLNEYDGSWIPPGWMEWAAIVRNSRYYNYSLNVNGNLEWHGFDYQKDYFTDLVANKSLHFIRKSILERPNMPFLAVISFPAPHGPEDPAPQFSDLFDGVETHRTKSWNYAPNPDKQWLLQRTGKMEPIHVAFTDQMQRRRLQTLQSVDDAMEKLVIGLRSVGQLHNTFIIFTSDHGYHLGQFGLVKGKAMPYEFDIRVPFFIRGPGLPRGKIINSMVANIDIAPTILAMAGLGEDAGMDGQSIMGIFDNEENGGEWSSRETILIERGKMPEMRGVRDRLRKQREGRRNKQRRLGRECTKPKYRNGCDDRKKERQWECVRTNMNGGGWKIRKCRGNEEDKEKECQCREKKQKKSRGRRKRMAKEMPWKEEEMEEEEEFFKEVMHEMDIKENGQWFQGKFGFEEDVEDETAEGKMDEMRELRESLDRPNKKRGKRDDKIDGCKCAKKNKHWKPMHPLLLLMRGKTHFSDLRRQMLEGSSKEGNESVVNCHIPQMNCFHHSALHWRTPPFWPPEFGQFCFCQNANNNSYWCLRTLNSTHNFLYCEFVTEELSFYDLNKDPHQLINSVHEISENILEQLNAQLRLLKSCRGKAQCEHFSSSKWHEPMPNTDNKMLKWKSNEIN